MSFRREDNAKIRLNSVSEMFGLPARSQETSISCLKTLVKLALSYTVYMREMFPESAFVEYETDDVSFKVLRETNTSPKSIQLLKLLGGAFEALEKHYLHKLTLGVHEEGARLDEIFESYSFEFDYTGAMIETSFEVMDSSSNKKKVPLPKDSRMVIYQAIRMVRSALLHVVALPPLPRNFFLTMRLHFCEKVTPKGYCPPGFLVVGKHDYSFNSLTLDINAGTVSTAFHSFSYDLKVAIDKLRANVNPVNEEKLPGTEKLFDIDEWNSDNENEDTVNVEKLPGTKMLSDLDEWNSDNQKEYPVNVGKLPGTELLFDSDEWNFENDIEESVNKEQTHCKVNTDLTKQQKEPELDENIQAPEYEDELIIEAFTENYLVEEGSFADKLVKDQLSSVEEESLQKHSYPDKISNCPCAATRSMGPLLRCSVCSFLSHGGCYGFVDVNSVPRQFVCAYCHNVSRGKLCPDSKMLSTSSNEQKDTCLYRQGLLYCLNNLIICPYQLSQELMIGMGEANAVVHHLKLDRIVGQLTAHGSRRRVDYVMLKYALHSYFAWPEHLEVKYYRKGNTQKRKRSMTEKMPRRKRVKTPQKAMALLHLQWTGDIPKAVDMIQKALDIDDKCEFGYETLGTIEVQRGNLKSAEKLFDKAIPLSKTELERSHLFSLRDAAVAQATVAEKMGIPLANVGLL